VEVELPPDRFELFGGRLVQAKPHERIWFSARFVGVAEV
jgi:hypothetical protein